MSDTRNVRPSALLKPTKTAEELMRKVRLGTHIIYILMGLPGEGQFSISNLLRKSRDFESMYKMLFSFQRRLSQKEANEMVDKAKSFIDRCTKVVSPRDPKIIISQVSDS